MRYGLQICKLRIHKRHGSLNCRHQLQFIYFVIAAVTVDSSQMTIIIRFVEQIQSTFKFCYWARVDNVVHGLSLATITRRWLGETPFVQDSTEMVRQRPLNSVTQQREIEMRRPVCSEARLRGRRAECLQSQTWVDSECRHQAAWTASRNVPDNITQLRHTSKYLS